MRVTVECEDGTVKSFDSPTEAAEYLLGLNTEDNTSRRRRLNGMVQRLEELIRARTWWDDAAAAYQRAMDAEYEDPALTVRCAGFPIFESPTQAFKMIKGLDRKIEMQRLRVQEMLHPDEEVPA